MAKPIDSVGKWISVIHRYGQIYIDRNLAQLGISSGQLPFLMLLYHQDGVSQEYLAKHLTIDKATTARAIQKLEQIGFIKRQPSAEDRRVNLVYLTADALKVRDQIRSAMCNWTEILTSGLSVEEKELLLNLLKKSSYNAVSYINNYEQGETV